jgi:hypothetical protein
MLYLSLCIIVNFNLSQQEVGVLGNYQLYFLYALSCDDGIIYFPKYSIIKRKSGVTALAPLGIDQNPTLYELLYAQLNLSSCLVYSIGNFPKFPILKKNRT